MADNVFNVTVDKNEITKTGKILSGVLLIACTLLPLVFIVGLWPNKMPEAGSEGYYANRLFGIELLKNGSGGGKIHINTVLFLLVALSGFMGSMVHVATSFTNYIGAGRFKRDWILWYFVKPFTAAGVAVIFYMVLNAGLLSGGASGGVGINPYGVVILAALAGLFTDKATLKLEEVFTILFQPKDPRPDRMEEKSVRITGLDPKKLLLDKDNNIIIKGENLDQGKLTVKINGEDVQNMKVEKNAISFSYKVAEALAKEKKVTVSVFDGVRLLTAEELELDGVVVAEAGQPERLPATNGTQNQNGEEDPKHDGEEELIDVDDIIKG